MGRDRRVAYRNILKLLVLKNMKIERKNRVGGQKVNLAKVKVLRLASYKDKQKILSKCNRLKGIKISKRIFQRRLSKLGNINVTG